VLCGVVGLVGCHLRQLIDVDCSAISHSDCHDLDVVVLDSVRKVQWMGVNIVNTICDQHHYSVVCNACSKRVVACLQCCADVCSCEWLGDGLHGCPCCDCVARERQQSVCIGRVVHCGELDVV